MRVGRKFAGRLAQFGRVDARIVQKPCSRSRYRTENCEERGAVANCAGAIRSPSSRLRRKSPAHARANTCGRILPPPALGHRPSRGSCETVPRTMKSAWQGASFGEYHDRFADVVSGTISLLSSGRQGKNSICAGREGLHHVQLRCVALGGCHGG